MAFKRGDHIKMLTWFEGLEDDPDIEYGTVVANLGDGTLYVETETCVYLYWKANERNTSIVSELPG
jgi:hypothetical protein